MILGQSLWHAFFESAVDTDEKFIQAMDALTREIGDRGKIKAKVAEGGMHFERLRIQNAQNQLAKATKPEERQAAQNEIAAAQKAGQIASKKYFRGKGLLNNVRVKMGKPAQP